MIRIIFIPTLIIALSFLARFISNYFSILFIQLLISGMLFLILMVSFLFLILWNDHKHRDLKLKIINFLNIRPKSKYKVKVLITAPIEFLPFKLGLIEKKEVVYAYQDY